MRVVKFILSVSIAMYGAAVNAVLSRNEECGNAHADGQLGPLVIKPLDKDREKNLRTSDASENSLGRTGDNAKKDRSQQHGSVGGGTKRVLTYD